MLTGRLLVPTVIRGVAFLAVRLLDGRLLRGRLLRSASWPPPSWRRLLARPSSARRPSWRGRLLGGGRRRPGRAGDGAVAGRAAPVAVAPGRRWRATSGRRADHAARASVVTPSAGAARRPRRPGAPPAAAGATRTETAPVARSGTHRRRSRTTLVPDDARVAATGASRAATGRELRADQVERPVESSAVGASASTTRRRRCATGRREPGEHLGGVADHGAGRGPARPVRPGRPPSTTTRRSPRRARRRPERATRVRACQPAARRRRRIAAGTCRRPGRATSVGADRHGPPAVDDVVGRARTPSGRQARTTRAVPSTVEGRPPVVDVDRVRRAACSTTRSPEPQPAARSARGRRGDRACAARPPTPWRGQPPTASRPTMRGRRAPGRSRTSGSRRDHVGAAARGRETVPSRDRRAARCGPGTDRQVRRRAGPCTESIVGAGRALEPARRRPSSPRRGRRGTDAGGEVARRRPGAGGASGPPADVGARRRRSRVAGVGQAVGERAEQRRRATRSRRYAAPRATLRGRALGAPRRPGPRRSRTARRTQRARAWRPSAGAGSATVARRLQQRRPRRCRSACSGSGRRPASTW